MTLLGKEGLSDTDDACPYKMTTFCKTFQNFSKLLKLFNTFRNLSKLFKTFQWNDNISQNFSSLIIVWVCTKHSPRIFISQHLNSQKYWPFRKGGNKKCSQHGAIFSNFLKFHWIQFRDFMSRPPGLPKQSFQEAVNQKFSQNHQHGALFHICLTFFTKLVQGFLITCKWLSKHSAPSERLYVKMSQNKQQNVKNVIYVGNVAYCHKIPRWAKILIDVRNLLSEM